MPQINAIADGGIDFEKTYEMLKKDSDVRILNQSGGGRGKHDNDCGNLYFEFCSLPGAKFQVASSGKIQVSFPDLSTVGYSFEECFSKLDECLAFNGTLCNHIICNEITKTDDIIIDQPLPREDPKEFYQGLKSQLEKELYLVQKILEALDSGRKTVVLVESDKCVLRLKRGCVLFFGDWSEEEKKTFQNNYCVADEFQPGDYDVVETPFDEPVSVFDEDT